VEINDGVSTLEGRTAAKPPLQTKEVPVHWTMARSRSSRLPVSAGHAPRKYQYIGSRISAELGCYSLLTVPLHQIWQG